MAEDEASRPTDREKVDAIRRNSRRLNREPSDNSIYKLVAKKLEDKVGKKGSLTADGIRRQCEKDKLREDAKEILDDLYQTHVTEGLVLVLDSAIPKTDYILEQIEPTISALLKIYGSYLQVGIAANRITKGAVKSATVQSLAKDNKTYCTKPVGDALTALLEISKLNQDMRADRRIFRGARLVDSKGDKLTVEDIIDGCAVLDDGRTARIGYPAEIIIERINLPGDDTAPSNIRQMREDLAQLRSTYKTDIKIAKTIHLLLDGAVNLDTRAAEAGLDETKCAEEIGDQLRLMERISRFDNRFVHNEIFKGAMLRDYADKTYTVTEVREYQAVLDGTIVVPMKCSARELNNILTTLQPEKYRMTLEKIQALIIEAVHYDKIRFDRCLWQKAFAGEDISIPMKSKFIAERMKTPFSYNPIYRYEINDIVRDREYQEVVVALDEGFAITTDHKGALHHYRNGSHPLKR